MKKNVSTMCLLLMCVYSLISAHASDSLLSSSYFGGTGDDGSWPTSVHVVDAQGNIYITGRTSSTDLPVTSGSYDVSYNGGDADCFVARFSPDCTTLLASTFLGGSDFDSGMAIWIGSDDAIYVVGDTASTDFPVTVGSYDTTYNGGSSSPYGVGDVFVARLTPDLSQMSTATYIGGSGHDIPKKMHMDSLGNFIISGHTNSQDFPTTAGVYAPDKAGNPLSEDCFVAILNPAMTELTAATYLGGSENDFCETLSVNSNGDIYIGGWVQSQDFPTTTGAYDTDYNGHTYDSFLSRFNSDLTILAASTYLGGSSWEFTYAMTLDESSNVYVAGHTASTDFPATTGAFDEDYNGDGGANVGDDVYVTCLNPDLSQVVASTYLGGGAWENAYGLLANAQSGVVVCGNTSSLNFPVGPMAWQSEFHGGDKYAGDTFITNLSLDLTTLLGSTYLGGSGDDGGQWISMVGQDQIVLSGYTSSLDYPVTTGAYQTTNQGGASDAFAAVLNLSLTSDPTPTPTAPFTPTPEPTQPCNLGVTIWMPLDMVSPGEPCQCIVTVCNNTAESMDGYPLFVILDVAGELFFAPSFNTEFDHYLELYPTYESGETDVEVLPEFLWPQGTGTFQGVYWYAGLTDPAMAELVGEFDMVTFGWSEDAIPTTMTMIDLNPGMFEMGAPESELCREEDEIFYTVTLTKGFSIQQTEVTQYQWELLMGSNPSQFEGMNQPVQSVTWFDACIYCNRLSLSEGLMPCYYSDETLMTVYDGEPPVLAGSVFWDHDADGYRLPTEAEWEYACRAGTTTAYYNGETSSDCSNDPYLDPVAWYRSNSNTGNGRETHRVGLKEPNAWGLYNMHGNVGEWCWDWNGPYPLGSAIDPIGPATGTERINRGGAFNYPSAYCRSANRWYDDPAAQQNYYGFRVVR